MTDVIGRFERLVRSTVAELKLKTSSTRFEAAFNQYKSLLQGPLDLYRDHSSTINPQSEALRSRFEYETALLHVITRAVAHDLLVTTGTRWKYWPSEDQSNVFSWYELGANLGTQIEGIATELLGSDSFREFISEASQRLRAKTKDYDLGEYYTPVPIVDHLIDISGLDPADLIAGKRVIDPSCGSGIVLISVAKRVVDYSRCGNCSAQEAMVALSNNLFGFDIQPIAVALAKTLLVHISCLLLVQDKTLQLPDFPNIRLVDTLTTDSEYWQGAGFFDYVIGNPPFASLKKEHILHVDRYDEVLYGHPNLYQLFLWWAVKATVIGGNVAFVLPQALLIGIYSAKLRERLTEITFPLAITRMIDRYGVVANADQQMMVVCLQVGANKIKPDVAVRVTRNGSDIRDTAPNLIASNSIVQNVASSTIWVVSDQKNDYSIVNKLEAKSIMLSDLNNVFQSGNGGFVWNQHKDLLSAEKAENAIPLISAASISPYAIEFPYIGIKPAHKRMFARVTDSVQVKVHTGQALLVQRTTPRKAGRRIVAAMLPTSFINENPRYFLENHVNYVRTLANTDLSLLYALNAWLNSDVINFLFQLRNGTAHISLYELNILPVAPELLSELSVKATRIVESPLDQRPYVIRDINKDIFEWLEIDYALQQRIEHIMQRRESSIDEQAN